MSLADTVEEYYREHPQHAEKLRQIVRRKASFSLRMVDWFVTNMSARKRSVFVNPKTGKVVDVNSDYKDVLRCYHKSNFDSFVRKPGTHSADLKQKNFFRWAFENGIVDYVEAHTQDIEEDMAEYRAPSAKRAGPVNKHEELATIFVNAENRVIPSFSDVVW